MDESLRALFFILALSFTAFWFLAKPLSSVITKYEFTHYRNSWLIIVIAAFLSPSFWFFLFVTIIILIIISSQRPEQRIIYYFLLLCAIPNVTNEIPGFGGINYIFDISYHRLLIIILLIPIFFISARRENNLPLFTVLSDRFLLLYLLLVTILVFRDNTFTNSLRDIFILWLDVFIPYYIFSRYISSKEQFNSIFAILLMTITPLAIIGIFETIKHWHLYHAFANNLTGQHGFYGSRAGLLRSYTVFDSSITFGFVLIIGFGALLYIKPLLKFSHHFYLLATIIIVALLSTLARGPWVGFVAFILAYLWTSKDRIKNLLLVLLLFTVIFPLLFVTKFGEKFLELLPFIGETGANTVSYRQQLLENAWIVIQRSPLFGSTNYKETPELESMRQGQGIIDLVNTYIQISLESGLVGLILFLMIFLTLIFASYKIIKKLPPDNTDLIRLGRVLIAILIGTMVTIGTVSSVGHIPIFYWAFAGITTAYIYVAKQAVTEKG